MVHARHARWSRAPSWWAGRVRPLPVWLLGTEVLATIAGLFLFGSFRYQIPKNALTYGMAGVVVATFVGLRWRGTGRSRHDAAGQYDAAVQAALPVAGPGLVDVPVEGSDAGRWVIKQAEIDSNRDT